MIISRMPDFAVPWSPVTIAHSLGEILLSAVPQRAGYDLIIGFNENLR